MRTGKSCCGIALNGLDEDGRTGDTVNVTRVITKEDTTKAEKPER